MYQLACILKLPYQRTIHHDPRSKGLVNNLHHERGWDLIHGKNCSVYYNVQYSIQIIILVKEGFEQHGNKYGGNTDPQH